ncbi:MAG: beta strand repeat-containing protein, partial [Verrucomicrobiota bacterium]
GQPLTWVTGNGTWDIGTSPNWQDATGAGGQYYLETALPGDNVVFGDLPGAGSYTVTLNSTVSPASVTVSNNLANYTIAGSGKIAGDGALVKDGSGMLVLSNSANAYLGGTWVKGGTLLVSAKAGGGSYTVADGATLGVLVSSSSLNAAAVSLGNCTASFIGISNNVNPVIANTGALTLAGVVTVNVTGGLLAGEHPLISSAAIGGTGGFVLGSVPDGVVANIITNGTTVVLNVISSPASTPFVWTGLNNANWDSATANNWTSNGVTVLFTNGHLVLFDDTAAQGQITVAENVSFTSLLVSNNALNYTFTSVGDAAMAGAGALAKSGTGTLVLANTNTYTGGTIINSGVLQLGDGLAQNGVVAGNITNNASLIFANPADQVFTNVIRGTGTVSKNAAGTLVLSNTANAYQGGTTVAEGTLVLGWTNSLGLPANPTNLATVLPGATLDINGQNLSDTYTPSAGYTITIAGTGSAPGKGALTSLTTPPDNRGVPNIHLADDATVGSDADSKFWIRGGISGAHTLTKIGSNSVVITAGTVISAEVPALVVSNGTLTTSATLGATPVRVYGPGTFALYTGTGIVFTNGLMLADGSTFLQTNGNNGWAAPIELNGNINFEVGRGSLGVSGSLIGTGSMTKTGAQQLTLLGTNSSYAGNINVAAGALEAAADGSLGTGNVSVAAGATLQLDTPATMSDTASLMLADSTALASLNYTGTQTVATLSFDGGVTPAAAGTWGAVGSGAANESASLSGTGLLQVSSITPPTPIPLAVQVSGGVLTLTWPEPGWYAQSNSVNVASSNQWFDIPGSETGTNLVRTVDSTQPHVFYRLRHP